MRLLSSIRLFSVHVLFAFIAIPSVAQIDSFRIMNLPFKVNVPQGWKVTQVDSGLCRNDDSNVTLEMPVTDYGCGGSIVITASPLTAKKRAQRKELRNERMADSISEFNWNVMMGTYRVYAGSIEQTTYKDEKPQDPALKKQYQQRKKLAKSNPAHRYSAWYFYSVNDSIEFLLAFHGRIPHKQEAEIDITLRVLAENFFVDDSASINKLMKWTEPYQNEPEFLPLKSLNVLQTKLRYAVLPEWKYDTTRNTNEIRTTFLKLEAPAVDVCNIASITVSYRITTNEKKDKNQESIRVPQIFGRPIPVRRPPPPDSTQLEKRDSLFRSSKQHYFFSQTYDSQRSSTCTGAEEISETVYIFVYTSSTERIRFNVTLNYTADEFRTARDFEHAYIRFLTSLIEENDFELFYENNKSE